MGLLTVPGMICVRPFLVVALFVSGIVFAGAAAAVTVPGDFPSIQAALDGAPPGSTIEVAPGRYQERLNLGPQHAVTLRGNPDDPASVVIDGGGQGDTIHMVEVGSGMVVEGFTVTGGTGSDGYGGGLFMADSHATFRRCVFTGNHAPQDGGGVMLLRSGGQFLDCVFQNNTAAVYGGGVMFTIGNTTRFERCSFLDNQSGTGPGIFGSGGGIHVNDSSPTFVGCRVQGNQSKGSGGGIIVLGHYSEPESVATFEDCVVEDNLAAVVDIHRGEGGGLHVEDNARIILRRTRVAENVANVGAGLHSYRAKYEIYDSLIENNHSVRQGDILGYGGGIAAQSVNVAEPVQLGASILLSGSVVRNNDATIGAGIFAQGDFVMTSNRATLTITRSLIVGNTANLNAGGIHIDRTDLTLTGSQVLLNRVTDTGFTAGGGLVMQVGATADVDDTTFAGNEAGPDGLGGAIYADHGGHLDVRDSRFYANRANDDGGAIAISETPGPHPSRMTGTVADSVFADDTSPSEIWEADCGAWGSDVVYRNNTFEPSGLVFARYCGGPSATVSAFNGLGSGKASGNVRETADFVDFHATPAAITVGDRSVLAWVTPAHGNLSIAPTVGGVSGRVGTADVMPGADTTYTLATAGDAIATATVEVECAAIGSIVPKTPADGTALQPPGEVVLAWHAASGALTYDVYLDSGADPSTLVGANVAGTSLAVPDLVPGTAYRWRVVAKSGACGEAQPSAVFAFTTCATATCESIDDFEDGDASDWTAIGKGTARVVNGRLEIRGKRELAMLAPVEAFDDGAFEFSLQFGRGRRQMRVLLGHRDANNFRELVVQQGRRWKLQGWDGGRVTRVAKGRRPIPPGATARVRIETEGPTVRVLVDGSEVLTGTFSAARAGRVGIRSVSSTLIVDDVVVAPRIGATPVSRGMRCMRRRRIVPCERRGTSL